MEVDRKIENNEITNENIQSFLLDVKKEFDKNENIRDKKKYLHKKLKKNFGIKYFRKEGIDRIYNKIIENINIYNDIYKKEVFFEFYIKKEILKLQKRSETFDKFHKDKILKIEEEIKDGVENYLHSSLEDKELENILNEIKIKDYFGDIDDIEELKISQTVLQTMGDEHKLLTFVIEVNGKKVNVDILKDKKGKIKRVYGTKDLFGNEKGLFKSSEIMTKKYDNPDAGVKLNKDYTVDKNKFNLEDEEVKTYENNRGEKKKQVNFSNDLRKEVKEGEKDEELNIFIQVIKEWNKIFKQNKKQLKKAKPEDREGIIDKNAQAIVDLFADNATLQGTMDFDNSVGSDGIKEYFVHFLAISPTMRFSKINEINRVEDGLLNVQGDYNFEVDNGEGGRESKDANFDFYFEYNKKTGKWGIKRLNSTFGKTEDNLIETEEEKKYKENKDS